MKTTLVLTALLLSSVSTFAADTTIMNDKNTVDSACTNEAQVAGCGNDVVGKGLLKCIHVYKKAHKKDFQISSSCKMAMEQLHSDKKAGK